MGKSYCCVSSFLSGYISLCLNFVKMAQCFFLRNQVLILICKWHWVKVKKGLCP